MRFQEIAGGFRIHISLEEQSIVDLINEKRLYESDLDEYDQELSRNMVSKGILNRRFEDDKIYYELNGLQNIWRI